jgi:hypothetical protein
MEILQILNDKVPTDNQALGRALEKLSSTISEWAFWGERKGNVQFWQTG